MIQPIARNLFRLSTLRTTARLAPTFKPIVSAQRWYSDHSETFEEFNARYQKFFEEVDDVFELQRGLNNCFAYDLVPSPAVIESAIKASRRVNDFATAVRIFEGIKDKVENEGQYLSYLNELKHIKEEYGINTKEELGY
ncbi:cytochrome c oxidase polypeptide VI mitochondrial precursor [Conidiobolus coronatus NRRL 28638]|jgi:cytochrome c oxidase subunit 5a|uniref:Cytochrome c oxidase subunit 6, mitochondrial n=1 Tax=Conidiobolus coronatus (strain ATCC 28846 / CBS 209.66 / NRRL 28638) TaxID=796925 RepID=A0A137P7M4_CONC2|nr:cytochrome c oxidase polypeptide VI mitochondrial precursor [Conidiobolus coronatus NRRL 28638]|eukprot:KXN70995.1 cytochrome c oxidase polypeptide VI mitochondrial precursor [Conidiobolus coronatus NRRL 28638]